MIYCFDIDGVICHTDGADYANAKPNWPVIERINNLAMEGHEIRYYTGRGFESSEDDWLDYLLLTVEQLVEWGLPHPKRLWPKPAADVYVDDRAVSFEEWIA